MELRAPQWKGLWGSCDIALGLCATTSNPNQPNMFLAHFPKLLTIIFLKSHNSIKLLSLIMSEIFSIFAHAPTSSRQAVRAVTLRCIGGRHSEFSTDIHPELAEHVLAITVWAPAPKVITPAILD